MQRFLWMPGCVVVFAVSGFAQPEAFDPKTFPNSIAALQRAAFLKTHGTPTQNPKFWDSMSANCFADENVPFEFSRILKEQLRNANRSVAFFDRHLK